MAAAGLVAVVLVAFDPGTLVLAADTARQSGAVIATTSTALAEDIQLPVRRAAELALAARAKAQAGAAKLDTFRRLVRTGAWTEAWPDPQGKPQTRQVTGEVWTAAIQAAIDQYNTVTIPAREQPYYLDAPVVLKSGQSLTADAKARLVEVADQKPNPDYPKTTPRGGTGRARLIP